MRLDSRLRGNDEQEPCYSGFNNYINYLWDVIRVTTKKLKYDIRPHHTPGPSSGQLAFEQVACICGLTLAGE